MKKRIIITSETLIIRAPVQCGRAGSFGRLSALSSINWFADDSEPQCLIE